MNKMFDEWTEEQSPVVISAEDYESTGMELSLEDYMAVVSDVNSIAKDIETNKAVINTGNEALEKLTNMGDTVSVESLVQIADSVGYELSVEEWGEEDAPVLATEAKDGMIKKIVEAIKKMFAKAWTMIKKLYVKFTVMLSDLYEKAKQLFKTIKSKVFSEDINTEEDTLDFISQNLGLYYYANGKSWSFDLMDAINNNYGDIGAAKNDVLMIAGTKEVTTDTKATLPSDLGMAPSITFNDSKMSDAMTFLIDKDRYLSKEDASTIATNGTLFGIKGNEAKVASITENTKVSDPFERAGTRKLVMSTLTIAPSTFVVDTEAKKFLTTKPELEALAASLVTHSKNLTKHAEEATKIIKDIDRDNKAAEKTDPELDTLLRSSLTIYNKLVNEKLTTGILWQYDHLKNVYIACAKQTRNVK